MATVTVVFYPGAINRFRGWSGPVGKSIHKLANDVAHVQRLLVAKKSGRLARSIHVDGRRYWAGGLQIDIGGHAPYAMANDQGARPHKIYPRRPGGMLVFYWPKVGHVVHFRSVNHPGNRGYHWAENGLKIAFGRWRASPIR